MKEKYTTCAGSVPHFGTFCVLRNCASNCLLPLQPLSGPLHPSLLFSGQLGHHTLVLSCFVELDLTCMQCITLSSLIGLPESATGHLHTSLTSSPMQLLWVYTLSAVSSVELCAHLSKNLMQAVSVSHTVLQRALGSLQYTSLDPSL
jgi:hypothetical protein